MRRNSFKTAQQHREFARAYVSGVPLKQALIRAGYSPAQAKKGRVILNKSRGLRQAILHHARLLIELGQAISADEQECLVRGRLILNVLMGTDKGVASAKALGSDKRVAMWQPEVQRGIIVVSPPNAFNRSILDGED